MNEARKKYLWSVYGVQMYATGWTDQRAEAVVLEWRNNGNGYETAQRVPFVARDAAHAREVALAAYQLWCIAHGEEVECEQRAVDA